MTLIASADYNTHLQGRVVHGALLSSFPYFKLKFFSLVKQQVDLCASAPLVVFVTSWRTLGRLPFVNWELSAPPQRLQLKKKRVPARCKMGRGKRSLFFSFPFQSSPPRSFIFPSPQASLQHTAKSLVSRTTLHMLLMSGECQAKPITCHISLLQLRSNLKISFS